MAMILIFGIDVYNYIDLLIQFLGASTQVHAFPCDRHLQAIWSIVFNQNSYKILIGP